MASELKKKNLDDANRIVTEMGANALPPRFAKLYSHATKLLNGQEGLKNWKEN